MKTWLKKGFVAWIAIFALTGTANAGLLLEPYVGYDFSMSGTLKTIAPAAEEDVSFSSYEVGGRLGWIFNWFGIGVDFDWKPAALKFKNQGDAEVDASTMNVGAFLGLYLGARAQWMIRGKYYFMSNTKIDADGAGFISGDKFKGTGYGVDLGYRFLSWLALNVEYTMITQDDFNGSTDQYELKTSDLLISVSFPFELFGGSNR